MESVNNFNKKVSGDLEVPIAWNSESINANQPIRVDYRDYLCDDEASKKLIKSLINFGVAFIEKVPTNVQQTEFAIRKLFPIQKTAFGEMKVIQQSKETTNNFHTANTYLNDAGGLQILHCLSFEGAEKAIELVDGFQVAKNIQVNSPDAFKRLCTTAIPHEYIEDGQHHKHTAPIISVDPITEKFKQIRYDLFDRAQMDQLPMNLMRQFYRDLKAISTEIEDSKNHWTFTLHPGTVIILDNWRILHSDTNAEGKKSVASCFVSRTDYLSIARTMGLIK